MKLIFMGTPEFAVPSLHALLAAGHTIQAVFTQPDKPVGRKQIVTPPPVKVAAQARNLTVLQPVKLRTPEARAQFEPLLSAADACVVAAYGRILPDWWLAAPRLGCINVHSSLLPKYRGAAPINWAIAEGEQETGVTIMQMDVGMDTGPMLLQKATPIGPDETAPELTRRLAAMGAELLSEALARLAQGELPPIPQNNDEATHAPLLKKEDGLVDWMRTAKEICNRHRAFTPFPGCYTMYDGQKLELISIRDEVGNAAYEPGTVVEITKDNFAVACGNTTQLRIAEIQPAGKRVMSVRDFLNGAKLTVGTKLG